MYEDKLSFSPIFIVGCGRSGTTLLGKILSLHPEVKYLNERRDIWEYAYPETDIWSKEAEDKGGKLLLTAKDEVYSKSELLRSKMIDELLINNKSILIEKLPINAFRLNFLNEIFPNSKYIHIFRNGFDVAKSIEERCINGKWYGKNSYKLAKLHEYAVSVANTRILPEICNTYFENGLLEWRLSTESIVKYLSSISNKRYVELSYDSLLRNTDFSLTKIFKFLRLESYSHEIEIAKSIIHDKGIKTNPNYFTIKNLMIGGKFLLPSTMKDNYAGLVSLFQYF